MKFISIDSRFKETSQRFFSSEYLYHLFILAACFLGSAGLQAQTIGSVQSGPLYTMAKVSSPGTYYTRLDNNFGALIKGTLEHKIGDVMHLEWGLGLSFWGFGFQDGRREAIDDNYTYHAGVTHSYKIQSLEVPVVLKYYFGSENVNFYVSTGLSQSFQLSGSSHEDVFTGISGPGPNVIESFEGTLDLQFFKGDYTESQLQEWKVPFAKSNFSLVGGGGIKIQAGNLQILFEALYQHGLSDLMPDPISAVYDEKYLVKVRRISLTAGVAFPI